MSHSYYYFAASLPLLSFDEPPPISVEDFLADARRLLRDDDARDLALLLQETGEDAKHPVARQWKTFEHQLRNEMAFLRAQRQHREPGDHVRGFRDAQPVLQEVIQLAMKSVDPLEGERVLDRFRWDRLEDLAAGHFYDMHILIVYGLKLRILERYARVASPDGREQLDVFQQIEIPQ